MSTQYDYIDPKIGVNGAPCWTVFASNKVFPSTCVDAGPDENAQLPETAHKAGIT